MTRLLATLATAALLAVLAPAAAAQEPTPTPTPVPTVTPAPTPEPRIRPGVRAGGVDLSNLTIPEATEKLEIELSGRLAENVVVAVAGRRFRLSPRGLRFVFDAERTAKRAYYAGENEPPDQPTGGGAVAQLDVPLAVRFRRAVVRDFANAIGRSVHIAPRNATVRITLRRMIRRRSRAGRDLREKALRAQVEAVLADPTTERLITPGRRRTPAKIRTKDLPRLYPTILTVDRANFKLRLFKRLRLVKTYGIAVGAAGYDTPTGRYRIQNKQVNPAWSAPNKPWAGLYAGRTVPGGAPDNPLKARWLGIANGVGIHGTGAEYSIGSRASHGCIRMRVADVIDLYPRVPVGTPVLIR